MTPRFVLAALMILPLAACEGIGLPGMKAAADAAPPRGHQGPPGVSPLDRPIETGTGGTPVATAEAGTLNTAAFSARGNEPFWSVDAAGGTAIYTTPENGKGQPIRVNRLNFAQGVEYVGMRGGRPFVLNIRSAECRDSMSGDRFPFTARLTVGGKSLTGCAAPAAPEVAQAVAATRAPAPAAPRQAAPRPAAARPAPEPAPKAAPEPEARPAAAKPTAPTSAPAAATPPNPTPTPTQSPAATSAPAPDGTAGLPPPPTAGAGSPASIVPPITVLPPLSTEDAAR